MVVVAFGQEKGLNVTTAFPMHFKSPFEVRVIPKSVRSVCATLGTWTNQAQQPPPPCANTGGWQGSEATTKSPKCFFL